MKIMICEPIKDIKNLIEYLKNNGYSITNSIFDCDSILFIKGWQNISYYNYYYEFAKNNNIEIIYECKLNIK